MAIVDNFYLRNQRKKLGGAVYYQAMGQTRSRELAAVVSNPRTAAQMTQRVRWANLVNLYRANKSWMKYAFETKKPNQSDYNKFMSLNVASSNIFLPKDIAAAGGCVVQAYQITQGSLPTIETIPLMEGSMWASNIILPDAADLSSMTVAQFAEAVLPNNPGMQEGDQLSFIRMTQMTNVYTGAPYVIVRKYEVILSRTNNTLLSEYLPLSYITSVANGSTTVLGVSNSGNAGGFALILSRTVSGKTFVSSQPIVVANNSALITAYSSAAALSEAVASYGSSEEPFLTTTEALEASSENILNSIVSFIADGNRFVPGSFFNITKDLAGKSFTIVFSSAFTETPSNIRVAYVSSTGESAFVMVTPALQSGVLTATFPAASALPEDAACTSIRVTTDQDAVYEAGFTVPNSYTIHGLE